MVRSCRAVVIGLALLLGACSTPGGGVASAPVQEMSDARQAVAAARRSAGGGGSDLALRRAEYWLERAREHLRAGDYAAARRAAREARESAQAARRR